MKSNARTRVIEYKSRLYREIVDKAIQEAVAKEPWLTDQELSDHLEELNIPCSKAGVFFSRRRQKMPNSHVRSRNFITVHLDKEQK